MIWLERNVVDRDEDDTLKFAEMVKKRIDEEERRQKEELLKKMETISQKEKGLDLFCESCGSLDVKHIISAPMPLLRGSSSGGCC